MGVGAKATARVPRRVLWIAVNLVLPATRAPLSAHAVITANSRRHPRVSTDSIRTVGRRQRETRNLAAAGRLLDQPAENCRDDCGLAEAPPSKATHPHLHSHHTRYDLLL